MQPEPEYKKKEKTTKLVYLDAVYNSIREGVSSNFVIPFALAMKAGSEYLALISTAPQLMGSFFQLFSSDLLNIVKNRKKVIFFTALMDSLLWIPILFIPFIWESNYILLLNFLILQSIATSLMNPFYNSLLGDVIPSDNRGSIFGRLNQISSILSFFSSLVAGFILAVYKPYNPFFGFAFIFFMAFFARIISSAIKLRFYEPPVATAEKGESLFHFGLNIRKSNFGQFVMYSSWMKFAVGIPGPFFAVYMLTYLKMDFFTFSLINSAAIISSFLVLNKLGRDIDKKGSRIMLITTGLLIPLVPVLWIIFKQSILLFIVELFSGAVWAGYNLSTSNFVMDATTSKNRLIMTSYFNFFIGVANFVGAMLGSLLFKSLPADFMGNIFYFVFGVSAVLRLCFTLYFMRKIKEERFVDVEISGPQSKRIVSIHPKEGTLWLYVPRKRV
jgi:MFS family permease